MYNYILYHYHTMQKNLIVIMFLASEYNNNGRAALTMYVVMYTIAIVASVNGQVAINACNLEKLQTWSVQ